MKKSIFTTAFRESASISSITAPLGKMRDELVSLADAKDARVARIDEEIMQLSAERAMCVAQSNKALEVANNIGGLL